MVKYSLTVPNPVGKLKKYNFYSKGCEREEYGRKVCREDGEAENRLIGMPEGSPGAGAPKYGGTDAYINESYLMLSVPCRMSKRSRVYTLRNQ